MKLVKVKDYPSLCRDMESGAVINTNHEEYEEYKKRKQQILAEKEKIKRQEEEINNIKKELGDIKTLLIKLLEAKDANDK